MKKAIIAILLILFLFASCADKAASKPKVVPNVPECKTAPDPGIAKGKFTKYYYDQKEFKCKPFNYTGEGGTVPFETIMQCQKACGQ